MSQGPLPSVQYGAIVRVIRPDAYRLSRTQPVPRDGRYGHRRDVGPSAILSSIRPIKRTSVGRIAMHTAARALSLFCAALKPISRAVAPYRRPGTRPFETSGSLTLPGMSSRAPPLQVIAPSLPQALPSAPSTSARGCRKGRAKSFAALAVSPTS